MEPPLYQLLTEAVRCKLFLVATTVSCAADDQSILAKLYGVYESGHLAHIQRLREISFGHTYIGRFSHHPSLPHMLLFRQ